MKTRGIALVAVMATIAQVSQARIVQFWSYDDLAKKADTILIVSVAKQSERTGAQENFYSLQLDKVRTAFKVHTVLKGKYAASDWELQHLAYPKNTPILNGWGFKWFDRTDEMYLVFLQTGKDETLAPVTGHEDLDISFIKLPSDMATQRKTQTQ